MSVNENPATGRHRSGSKISETMAPIVADPGRAAADACPRACFAREYPGQALRQLIVDALIGSTPDIIGSEDDLWHGKERSR